MPDEDGGPVPAGPAPVGPDRQAEEEAAAEERRRQEAVRAAEGELRACLGAYLREDWRRARKRLAARIHALAGELAGQATVQERTRFESRLSASEREVLFEKRAPGPRASAVKTHSALAAGAIPDSAAGEAGRRAVFLNRRTPSETTLDAEAGRPAPHVLIDPPNRSTPPSHERPPLEEAERHERQSPQQQREIEDDGLSL
jgi:hypothetical protein